jgi:hypothetical protein
MEGEIIQAVPLFGVFQDPQLFGHNWFPAFFLWELTVRDQSGRVDSMEPNSYSQALLTSFDIY